MHVSTSIKYSQLFWFLVFIIIKKKFYRNYKGEKGDGKMVERDFIIFSGCHKS